MASKTFNISMDEELLMKIDAAAKANYTSRSDYLRMAALQSLESNQVTNTQAMDAAQRILDEHRKDFDNLARR